MKKSAAALIFCIVIAKAHPQMAVFDPTNWLVAIDQLYSSYDQVMNTIQQIQYQYEQIQHYYNEARTWQFDDIQWDGDWDFRNEIKQATSSVNRQINNIRMLEYNLTKRQISLGGYSYTLSDLAGVGQGDNLIDALQNTGSWMKNDVMVKAAAGFEGKLDEKQKAAIWRKYGLSPANYYYMTAKKQQFASAMQKVVAWGMEESLEQNITSTEENSTSIVAAAMSEDSTEKSLMQQQIMMHKLLIEQLNRMLAQMSQTAEMTAWYQAISDEQETLKQAERAALQEDRVKNNGPGSLF
jgi:hypothetical protein